MADEAKLNAIFDAAHSGQLAAILLLSTVFVLAFAARLYLVIGAALALVEAETGGVASFRWKFGAGFAFLPHHRRFLHPPTYPPTCGARGGGRPDYRSLANRAVDRRAHGLGAPLSGADRASTWESFGRYADELLRRLDGRVVERGSSADMHLWAVEIETVPLRLVYEDFPNRVNLESDSYPGDKLLRSLQARLVPATKR